MAIVVEQVVLLLMFICVGFLLAKTKLIDSKHTKILSTLSVYVFLSSNIFRTFATNFTPVYLREKYVLILVSLGVLVTMVGIAWVIAKLMTQNKYKQNIIHYSLTVPNYGYAGYAMAEGVYDSVMLQNVMMVTVPISAYTYTVGYCMLTNNKFSLKRLLNPITIAMVCGAVVGFFGIPVPNVLDLFLSKSSACMAPTAMILAGAVIAEYKIPQLLRRVDVYIITALRLLVLPIVTGVVLRLLHLEVAMIPMMLIVCMPCGLNTIIFPKLIGEDCQTGAALAFVTNILSCVTVPLMFALFGLNP